jgi:hypothetical protein
MSSEATEPSRPSSSLAGVAACSTSFADFERNLQDYLEALREFSTRAQVATTIASEPSLLAGQFPHGDAADACLAAYAEWISLRLKLRAPVWVDSPTRIRSEPWLGEVESGPSADRAALVHSPLPFKRRNLHAADIDLRLSIRPGRPSVTVEHKQRRNAERQRRFRARRAADIKELAFHRAAHGRFQSAVRSKLNSSDITLDLQTLP